MGALGMRIVVTNSGEPIYRQIERQVARAVLTGEVRDGAVAYPGATATYDVTITNNGSVPAILGDITGLSDVTFTNQDPATAASSAQSVCVWSNTATKAYTITATGSGTANAFT